MVTFYLAETDAIKLVHNDTIIRLRLSILVSTLCSLSLRVHVVKYVVKWSQLQLKRSITQGKISSGENNFFSQIDLLYIKVLIEKGV